MHFFTAFILAHHGGLALAQLLYGQESPSGRLPISIPAHVGQLPVYYNPKRSYERR
ncbi:MAG: glycoside hydrolase family 3 C-terminal domain-containing protein [Lachnospiraceae bacterium]